jgi:hypothetical protein
MSVAMSKERRRSELKSYVTRFGPSWEELEDHINAYEQFFEVVAEHHIFISELVAYYGITDDQDDQRWSNKGWLMFFVHALDRQFAEIRSWENQPERYADVILSLYGLARQPCDAATAAALYALEEAEVQRIHKSEITFLQNDDGKAALQCALRNAWDEARPVPLSHQTPSREDDLDRRYQQLTTLLGDVSAKTAFDPLNVTDARQRVLAAIVRRRGQADFRAKLIEAYNGRCAMTGCDAVDALEAAHIIAYRGATTNTIENGLLLRADIHTLFDLGLIAVDTATMCILVSPRLSTTQYRSLSGRRLQLPSEEHVQPNRLALDRHRKSAGL